MTQKIVVGPMNLGLKLDREPFYINNENFNKLINAYQWRGRIKRKRGTSPLTRFIRYLFPTEFPKGYQVAALGTTDGSGNLSANIISLYSLESTASIAPGTISITDGTNTFIEPTIPDGTLTGSPGGSGTINYATGAITLTGAAPNEPVTGEIGYYPGLPVMGLKDLNLTGLQFPMTLGFDTKYAYNILQNTPFPNYNVNYYKNPAVNSTNLPAYSPKTVNTAFNWNGQNYQQFASTNYQYAFWAGNGLQVPFSTSNIGMQFKAITAVSIVATGPYPAGPPASATLTIASHGLVLGDFVYVNEVVGITGINFQTGYVTTVVNNNNVTVTFPYATLGGAYTSGGIAQYLTNTAIPTVDCIRWYDGDPTNGQPLNLLVNQPKGWVNFAPPLSQAIYSIGDLPEAQYYLVGCKTLLQFKDRLVFFGVVVQSSTTGPFYLQDTIVYSQNGTPYYTSSFTGSPVSAATTFLPTLAPDNQGAMAPAYFEDVAGFGGFLTAGFSQPIISVAPNRDVLIVGFTNRQLKLQSTALDLLPFEFYIVNSEYGTGSTFSTIVFDEYVTSAGDRGLINTSEAQAGRIDLDIPDNVFQFEYINNGSERITAVRDYINEWIYITYVSNELSPFSIFPDQSLFWNYRDQSWSVMNETYTTYGQFRKNSGFTWATIGLVYPTWNAWTDPWIAGESTLEQPQVICGNQQGFVVCRDDGTQEAPSLFIKSYLAGTFTVPNHNLADGDYITISGILGTIGTQLNGKVFSVIVTGTNTFTLNPATNVAGTYLGLGVIKRMYVPFIQTRQFPVAWAYGRKTRIGPQMYLFTSTTKGQIELQIYLSQNAATPFNQPPLVPSVSQNNTLIYSDILYTCQESTNLGLTPANINLQQITPAQAQIWHRMNTSLIGDTVQLAFTMSDAQMRDTTLTLQFLEIEFHGMVIDVTPSQLLA